MNTKDISQSIEHKEWLITVVELNDLNYLLLIFVKEIDLEFIEKKIVIYAKTEVAQKIVGLLESELKRGVIRMSDLENQIQKLTQEKLVIKRVPFISDNNNRTSRDKRLLASLGLEDFKRFTIYVGS